MVKFITAEELESARKWLAENNQTENDVGGYTLGKGIGIGERRARSILDKLRGAATLHKPHLSADADSSEMLASKRADIENQQLKAKINELLEQQVIDQRYQEFIAEVAASNREYPKWALEPKSGKRNQAMPIAHMSDWHFDEVVDPKQVGFVNGYNREIATKRLKRFFERRRDAGRAP